MDKGHADTVFIENLRIAGKHGVLSHERKIDQEFVLDIVARFDARKAAASDQLADTINYMRFKEIAEQVIAGPHNFLIERIATRIADEILMDTRISEVYIKIRKPAVITNGVAGISITRKQKKKYHAA